MVTAFIPRSVTDLTVECNGCLSYPPPQSEQDCVTQPSVGPPGAKGAVLRWENRDEWLDDGALTERKKHLSTSVSETWRPTRTPPSPEKKPNQIGRASC